MNETTLDQIMTLKTSSLEELKVKYVELFQDEPPSSNNKVYIWRKLAYKLQEIEHGGLSEATQGRINELIEKYDPVNNQTLRPKETPHKGKKKGLSRDRRLPIPGTIIKKEYKGRMLEVKVLEKGFEYEGKTYRTLSAVASALTGAHWNGYLFFKP